MSSNVRHEGITLNLGSQIEGGSDRRQYFDTYQYNASDRIVLYGDNNQHPERIKKLEECSLLHSRIVSIATDLIAGDITFRVKGKEAHDISSSDENHFEEAKEFYRVSRLTAWNRVRAYNLYNYGYAPQLLNFEVSAFAGTPRKLSVASRPAREFRLGVHRNTFFGERPEYHYYSYFWHLINDAKLTGFQIKTPKRFFSSKKLSDRHVMRVNVLEDGSVLGDQKGGAFSYLIGMPKKTNRFYPKPFWESQIAWEKIAAEYELAVTNRNTIKRGLRTDYLVNVYRTVYNNPAGDDTVVQQKTSDQQEIEDNLLGFGNAGTVKINFIGLKDGNLEDKRVSDGYIDYVPVPNVNNYKELQERKKDIVEDILIAHAFGITPMAGITLEKTAFSNMAEYLLYLSEIYVNCVIKPHVAQVDKFYNEIINPNTGFDDLTTVTQIQVPVMRALVAQFKDCLTQNEIREDVFGKEPLTDSDRREVDDVDEGEVAEQLAKRIAYVG